MQAEKVSGSAPIEPMGEGGGQITNRPDIRAAGGARGSKRLARWRLLEGVIRAASRDVGGGGHSATSPHVVCPGQVRPNRGRGPLQKGANWPIWHFLVVG